MIEGIGENRPKGAVGVFLILFNAEFQQIEDARLLEFGKR